MRTKSGRILKADQFGASSYPLFLSLPGFVRLLSTSLLHNSVKSTRTIGLLAEY